MSIDYRMEKVELEVKDVKNRVGDICETDLPAINNSITRLETSMKIYGGLIIAGISVLIALGLTP